MTEENGRKILKDVGYSMMTPQGYEKCHRQWREAGQLLLEIRNAGLCPKCGSFLDVYVYDYQGHRGLATCTRPDCATRMSLAGSGFARYFGPVFDRDVSGLDKSDRMDWLRILAALDYSEDHGPVVVSREVYEWFLGVLPPRRMFGTWHVFQEGAGKPVLFWRDGGECKAWTMPRLYDADCYAVRHIMMQKLREGWKRDPEERLKQIAEAEVHTVLSTRHRFDNPYGLLASRLHAAGDVLSAAQGDLYRYDNLVMKMLREHGTRALKLKVWPDNSNLAHGPYTAEGLLRGDYATGDKGRLFGYAFQVMQWAQPCRRGTRVRSLTAHERARNPFTDHVERLPIFDSLEKAAHWMLDNEICGRIQQYALDPWGRISPITAGQHDPPERLRYPCVCQDEQTIFV